MQDEFYSGAKEGLLEPLAVGRAVGDILAVGDGMRTLRGISGASSWRAINIVAIAQDLLSVPFLWW